MVRDGRKGEEVLRWSGEREEVGGEERTECGPLACYEAARRPLAEASRERQRLMGVEPIPPQADPPSAESGGDALTLLPLPLVVPAAAQSGRRFAAEGTYSSREEARAREREWGWGRRGSHAAAAVAAATDRGKEAGWGLLLFPTERADERPTASTAATRACNPSRVDNWEPKGRGGASAPRMDGHGHGRCQSQRRVGTRTLKRCGPRGVRRHAERHMMVSDPRAGPAFSPRRINDSNANQTVATREGLPTTFTSSVMDFRDENDLCGVPL